MARILICHVPKDGSVARDLGAALMGRGHFVSFDGEPDTLRPERASRLRQFEAVIVVWTETSAQSNGLAEIARETLPLNLLIPVRADDLETSRLPLMFRKLNMLAPRDVDGIARLVARLSTAASSLRDMAEREQIRRSAAPAQHAPEQPRTSARPPPLPKAPDRTAAGGSSDRYAAKPIVEPAMARRARPLFDLPEVEADLASVVPRRDFAPEPPRVRDPAPPQRPVARAPQDRPTAPVVTAEDLAKAVDNGLLVYHIPEAMWLGVPTTVELTLGRDILAGLMQAEVGHGGIAGEDRQSVETLSVSLYGNADAFEIERQSERTQFVSTRYAQSVRDPATFGRWAWLVTPRAAGPYELVVRISALLRDHHGVPAPVALPDRRFGIEIRVPQGESLVSALAGWHRR
ncbi:MAG: hypothetical protein JNN24_16260 [Hyphomicrobium zavarzinii]|jgi:hypothetical protein|uniref:hypothetical protein n=1 Tax=Hyphomicrobium TaxID=81 RepID=UPI001A48689B|nr:MULTISPECIES: hypothetical protein [Hyphomicrobium]MBL8847319.1 hypothetical protein [Hyphomicrobium zavarzinii]WBT37361.1 hypothetical protein PE058_17095 [Hyphomicrobium sp. DMF-1]HML43809.1 hypothetical protein [Hyphomicrobium zavarzinii]